MTLENSSTFTLDHLANSFYCKKGGALSSFGGFWRLQVRTATGSLATSLSSRLLRISTFSSSRLPERKCSTIDGFLLSGHLLQMKREDYDEQTG